MQVQQLSFQETGRFSTLICDYISAKKELAPFYGAFPELDNFASQIGAEEKNFFNPSKKDLGRSFARTICNASAFQKSV
jgi:hypothetical protein